MSATPIDRTRRRAVRILAGLAVCASLALVMAPAGCAPPPNDLRFSRDEQFSIRDPGEPGTAVTGVGCGLSKKEALVNARRQARYNLRGVMGTRRFRVDFNVLDRMPDSDRICYEVEAVAVF